MASFNDFHRDEVSLVLDLVSSRGKVKCQKNWMCIRAFVHLCMDDAVAQDWFYYVHSSRIKFRGDAT